MKVVVKNRQCLADIALQVCGSVEAVFSLAERNGLSITDELAVGQILIYEPTDIEDKRVVAALAIDRVCPAGAADARTLNLLLAGVDTETGIGLLDSTSDTIETTSTTAIFTREFDLTFA